MEQRRMRRLRRTNLPPTRLATQLDLQKGIEDFPRMGETDTTENVLKLLKEAPAG
jgi:hypothetical protein